MDLPHRRERHGFQFLGRDLQHGQVGTRIRADHDGGINLLIVGRHPDLLGVADHVFVGQDETIGVDEEAGAHCTRDAIEDRIKLRSAQVIAAQRIVRINRRDGCRDRDDGGRRFIGDLFEMRLEVGELQSLVVGADRLSR